MPYPTIENYPYLKLTYGSSSVTFDQLSAYDRKVLQGAKVDYSFSGNATIRRTPHEPKHLWTVTAIASWSQRSRFDSLVKQADRQLFTPPFNAYKITLDDVQFSFIEPEITRPKAVDFQETGEDGEIEYFAKFLVSIDLETVSYSSLGDWVQIAFTMNELEKLTV